MGLYQSNDPVSDSNCGQLILLSLGSEGGLYGPKGNENLLHAGMPGAYGYMS